MLDRFAAFADKYDMLPRGGLVLAAVSGGADSVCLLGLLLEARERLGISVEAMHFNHRLRGAESDRDQQFVSELCRGRGLCCHTGSGDVSGFADAAGMGTEEAARIMRYAFFDETAEKTGAARIATAHNADDNAETILLDLTRGAGLRGLCGIPPVRGRIVRPLLCFTRAEIEGFLAERGLPHVEDSTNACDDFARNRIRHAVTPVLRGINPGFPGAAARCAELLRRDDEYLCALADGFVRSQAGAGRAPARALAELPYPIASRAVRALCGCGLSAAHVDAVLKLCESGGPSDKLSLPGLTVAREYGDVVFGAPCPPPGFAPVEPRAGESAVIPELGLRVRCENTVCDDKIHKSFTTFLFKKAELCGKIIIRPRATGDSIKIPGRNGTKTLKRLFIEERIPAGKRGLVPVIADDAGVLAVAGLGAGTRAAPRAGDSAVKITLEEIG